MVGFLGFLAFVSFATIVIWTVFFYEGKFDGGTFFFASFFSICVGFALLWMIWGVPPDPVQLPKSPAETVMEYRKDCMNNSSMATKRSAEECVQLFPLYTYQTTR